MPIANSKELLDFLLEGGKLAPGDVESLIAQVAKEDLYLDYKSGRKTTPKDLKHTIRRWVTGFANADGGTLALGISERKPDSNDTRKVVGIDVPGGGEADDWATRILSPLAGRFSPPPRLTLTKHSDGDVLFVAALRAPQLISYAEQNEPRYALRIGDSTVDVPPYLLSDLLLGRRNQPIVEIREIKAELSTRDAAETKIRLRFVLENLGFVAAEETEVGVVCWSYSEGTGEENANLLQFIDRSEEPVDNYVFGVERAWTVRRSKSNALPPSIRPFDSTGSYVHVGPFPVYGPAVARFAIYVMPRGSMPQWYEVRCRYKFVQRGSEPVTLGGETTFERVVVEGRF